MIPEEEEEEEEKEEDVVGEKESYVATFCEPINGEFDVHPKARLLLEQKDYFSSVEHLGFLVFKQAEKLRSEIPEDAERYVVYLEVSCLAFSCFAVRYIQMMDDFNVLWTVRDGVYVVIRESEKLGLFNYETTVARYTTE